ncbi:DUF4832 domain-containing protein [uncultured Pseudokineococcus sp.]|uniref:DUF4832 domain-containing protein n=1 Tax=uncultured Pseudokineococcus sp. TaxID=1642928 RepID=UPI0026098E6E|nr:DUF4832 domain-containing protein [uncultured Pseudokineococcus sp.]
MAEQHRAGTPGRTTAPAAGAAHRRPGRRARGLALLALPGLVGLAGAPTASADPTGAEGRVRAVQYAESDDVLANPERGWYRHTETHYREDGSGYTPLDADVLRGYRAEGTTQVLRVFYLERFAETPQLDQAWLDLVQADLDTAREAGVSVITRFAYRQGGAWPYSPPYGDAPLDVVLAHIEQLSPLLHRNADVVPVLQQGFVGLWGEGYYTDHFVADPAEPGVVTEEDWERRGQVLRALLDAVPQERSVQVRTMLTKQVVFDVPSGEAGALAPEEAFGGSDLARVGHHNDCFLASPDDFGTFLSDPLSLDQEYLARETRFVPMGGETCTVNPPRSEYPSASAEMARYHFSYLNADYNRDVLGSWGEDGLAEVTDRLGYRFVPEESRVRRTSSGGRPTQELAVDVRNDGWAAPYNERPVHVVLEGARGAFALDTGVDARTWAAGTTSTVSVPLCGVPTGRYALHLHLPSGDAGTAGNPDFSVRLAAEGTWEPATGWNDLQQEVVVTGGGAGCDVEVSPLAPAPRG